jgi:hypothetical protein
MTNTEEIAMLKAEVESLRNRLARYEGDGKKPNLTAWGGPIPAGGLTNTPMLRPLRKRRGPVTRQHAGDPI